MSIKRIRWILTGLSLLWILSQGCSVSPNPKQDMPDLVPKDAQVFDKRFQDIDVKDLNLSQFWVRSPQGEVREPINLNTNTYSSLVDEVKNGVVNIYTLRLEEHDARFGLSPNDIFPFRLPLLSSLFDIIPFQVPIPYRTEGLSLGSGFIINPEGYILTNAHVVFNATEIRVVLAEGQGEIPARIIGIDRMTDTALLKAEAGIPLQALPFGNSESLKVGDMVIAIGNPLGLTHTMTSGLVSAKQRIVPGAKSQVLDFLQTDSAINPGSSGGPLINMYGEVVGINTAIISDAQLVGFAIPIDTVKEVMPLLVTGNVKRGWLGASGIPLTAKDAVELGYSKPTGILIKGVEKESPAEQSGLMANDIIIELNGEAMDDFLYFRRKLLGLMPGRKLSLKVFRKDELIDITATLADKPEED